MLAGTFPEFVRDQFAEMLDYFGQAPIVVRSSSLLEDSFGNAFSGKYESVFCANQGSPQERLEAFLAAVRHIYASAMGREALLYRAQRGLLDRDEQMALLVQRVSGAVYGRLFFPQVAGVGLSFNPYAWSEQIDPKAGVLRLVFGLGTRAVSRSDDDYTRIVALNAPARRPETTSSEVRGYAQWRVDVLDLEKKAARARDLSRKSSGPAASNAIEMVAWRDPELIRRARETGRPALSLGPHFRQAALARPLRGRHARLARDAREGLRLSRGHRVHGELPSGRQLSHQPGAMPAVPGQGRRARRRAAGGRCRRRSRSEDAGRRHRPKPG